ncbi:MAG TPA: hypothetical protein VFW00_12940, partial [Rhodocyclaceae bacterium]|nr:hypothetical protein [Rhodocyclaceae bacterium]
GTRSWRRALAVDQQLGDANKVGAEWSMRSLDVAKVGCLALSGSCIANWRERAHRAYWSGVITPTLALSAEWRYESMRLNEDFSTTGGASNSLSVPLRTRTEQWPVRAWWHITPEFSASFEERRVRQDTVTLNTGAIETLGSTHFWVSSASIRQRLDNGNYWWELAVNNIFNQHFLYQDTNLAGDPRVPEFWPTRMLTVRLNGQW